MPLRKAAIDLTDKENPPDRPSTPQPKMFRKPKAKVSALAEFQAKVAATRAAGRSGGLPPPPQSTANPPAPAQSTSTRPALRQSTRHQTTQPQAHTQASVQALPAADRANSLAPPGPPSQAESKSSLTYADLPSDGEDPFATSIKLPPRLSKVTAGLGTELAPRLSSSSRAPAPAARPRPSQPGATGPPLARTAPPTQPRASTSSTVIPASALVDPTTKPPSRRKPQVPSRLAPSSSGPVRPEREPTPATAHEPGPASRRTSTVSHTSGPSAAHRSHKALAGQPPPPAELPPPEELKLDPAALFASFQQSHAEVRGERERRVDVDEGVEYVSAEEDDGGMAEVAAGEAKADEMEFSFGKGQAREPGMFGGGGSDEEGSGNEEHALGEQDLADLLGLPQPVASGPNEQSTSQPQPRSLRPRSTAEDSVTPTLNGSSDAVQSRGTGSTNSSTRKRKPRSPSPESEADSDELPPHLVTAKRSKQAKAKAGGAKKGVAVIKRRAPTAFEDRPVESSSGAMALLPPRRKKEEEDSEMDSVTVDSDEDEDEDGDYGGSKRPFKASRTNGGKRAAASSPSKRGRRTKRSATPGSSSTGTTKPRRKVKKQEFTIVEEDEDEETEAKRERKYEKERQRRLREIEEIDAYELEEVLVLG